ncbi:MAG TPA: aminotransferase class I/II-fold pyridoxal phosphate-dependent enzyme, partial [Bacteroidetes bacterium]|nr:aminotransferase class I/II-fold pyridoxal phosphate-dependent enzyme [Bacteroidota bacterium]HEX03667.1 aminotransferase class I/II-fold pyridoxal phosphate-dependent enzyme [Bacteroidota bacterium]
LFSNTLSPMISKASIAAFDLIDQSEDLIETLHRNTDYFRKVMLDLGFDIKPSESPIVPIMIYDAPKAQEFANRLLDEGIYVIGFFYPVVAKGQARIRVQLSAAHTREQLDTAMRAFETIGRELGVI